MFDLMRELAIESRSKIVLLVADGLGGLPREPGGPTELEAAATPHLDALVARHVCGLSIPVAPGIAPGSGPGHLGLFGYDPRAYTIGRGVLEALGIDFDVGADDVAARGNFCTVDAAGNITDRRAGRISSELGRELVEELRAVRIEGAKIFVEPVRDYRFVLVVRAPGLGEAIDDTDPGMTGVAPHKPQGSDPASQRTAAILESFIRQAAEILKERRPANMVTLRGVAKRPAIPQFEEVYRLRAGAIAVYPMYRGLARLVGMTIYRPGTDLTGQIEALRRHWDDADFFFVHYKSPDAAGEDGDFDRKVACIEELDKAIPAIMDLGPDVLIVTGDHSTPAALRSHSWHPVPVLLAAKSCRPDAETTFGEGACLRGGLGQIEAKYLMPLALAHAGRLAKFGA
ncbi:MAG TPA: 2,3-bisphosphoglycerate-independent phosphoglycerate mutase [Geminicoccaceae bacterium]|nr:2,3-bisphosphoglycerate-independent phosphoglycerate mutase [Geminicoccaceae bacterium]